MRPKDLLQETYTSLSANRTRSGLTMLGIVIGIMSVIVMLSIGQGAQNSIRSSIEGLGSNLLTILPGVAQPGRGIVSSGRGAAETLKSEDVEIIEETDGVAMVSPEVMRRFQVTANTGNNTNTTVTGGTEIYAVVHNLELATGSFFSAENVRGLGRQAVIGATVATDLFGENDALGQTVRISGNSFRVIGVLEKKGGLGFSGPDDMVIVPLSTMQKILTGEDSFSSIAVSVTDKDRMSEVQSVLIDALIAKHDVEEADFSILSQQDILGTLSSVITTFTLFLASIAGISLLVGGIGIMNMMLTTVTERTKEIGLRKAIGATSTDISMQFLAEAVALTGIGGAVGILLGWLICLAVTSTGLIATAVSPFSVLLGFGVSAAIGIVFGYYPARRAARMNPIDALRYE